MTALTIALRAFITVVLALAFAGVLSAWLAATTVTDNLLDSSFYIDAARQADVYERIYDRRVFAEQLQDTTFRVTGGIQVEERDVVAVVREIAPPEYVQLQVERAITRMTDFARGDTDRLDLSIDLAEPIEQIKPVVVGYVRDRLRDLPEREADSPEQFVTYLQQSLADLQGGRLPVEIVSFPVPEAELDRALDVVFPAGAGLSGAERAEIRDALLEGRTVDAFLTAADFLIEPVYQSALRELKRDIGGDGLVLDPVERAAASEGESTDQFNAGLRDFRDVLNRIEGFAGLGGPLLLLLIAALIAGVHLPRIRSGLFWAGIVATTSALVVILSATVAKLIVPDTIVGMIDTRNTTGNGALNPIVGDVVRDLADQVANGWLIRAAIVAAAGLTLVVVSRLVVDRDPYEDDAS